MKKKTEYLSNKSLMAEINRSKITYCSFIDDQYANYDHIVGTGQKPGTIADITEKEIKIAKEKVAKRLSMEELQRKRAARFALGFKSCNAMLEPVDLDSIPLESIVFRVITYDHIPKEQRRGPRNKLATNHAKVPFVPFKHYIIKDGAPFEVGRSHWQGGLSNGHFSANHGHYTDALARMFMLMVNRFSTKGNWNGYCVDEQTEALTQRGWLRYDEINESDIILSYDDGKLKWSKIKSIFRDEYDGKMFRLKHTYIDALVTPGHSFITKDGLQKVEYLRQRDRLILMGSAVENTIEQYSDAFIELIGWVVTEGCYNHDPMRNYCRVSIFQNEGPYADRIKECLRTLGAKFGEGRRKTNMLSFILTKDICEQILVVAPTKIPTMSFILSLSTRQREILINTMLDGDGWRTTRSGGKERGYCQKDKKHMDNFLALLAMSGYRASINRRDIVSFGKPTHIYIASIYSSRRNMALFSSIDLAGGERGRKGKWKEDVPNKPMTDYKGMVWCPETEYGSFMARRNSHMYLTGNTWRSELCGDALLHLMQVGLKFDESITDNPFAFYSQAMKNSFIRSNSGQKRHGEIRDNLLMALGESPSFNRQVRDEGQ